MLTGRVSVVKALQDYFTENPNGKKISMDEFKALTYQDKVELRNLLIDEGYDVAEIEPPK